MFFASTAQRGLASPYDSLLADASMATGVPVALLKAVIARESNWDPSAASSSSVGLMQINVQAWGVATAQALDPAWNIQKGASILADQLTRRGGSVALAVAAYNAGTNRTDADLEARIAANTNGVGGYVADVLAYQAWYDSSDPASGAPLGDTLPNTPPISGGSGMLDTLFGPAGMLTGGAPLGDPGVGPGTDDPYPGLDLGTAAGLPVTVLLVGLALVWWVAWR